MARRLGLVILGLAIVAAWAFGQTKPEKPAAVPAATSAPAAKNGSGKKPLLLLDDEQPDPASRHMADNSRCFVCHTNFQKEALVVTHARAQIGCAKCHGPCDAHIDDESWTSGGKGTPPDKMYVRSKVIPFCVTCHDLSTTDASGCPFPKMKQKQVCTDCHGKHRLAQRKCKWK